MISEIANVVIVVMFGILIGVMGRVFSAIAALQRRKLIEAKFQLSKMPRSFLVSTSVAYAIIGLFVMTLKYTDVHMRWIPFLVSYVLGFFVADWIFDAAKSSARRRGQDNLQDHTSC